MALGNPTAPARADELIVGTISNLSSCEHQAEDPGSLATSPYAIWNDPCGAEIFPPPNFFPVSPPYYSRFRVIPAALNVSSNELRLTVDASVVTDETGASPYEYQVGVVDIQFTVSIDVGATTAWELDLSQVAQGMIATYDEGTPQGFSSATAGAGIQLFSCAVDGQNVGFDSPSYGALITTGFGPSTSAIVFDGSRSDTAVLTGLGPRNLVVEFQTRMDVASRGNEAVVAFGLDGVLPSYTTGGGLGGTFSESLVDNYGWLSPPPGFGYAWPRPVEPDGWTATLTLRVLDPACSNGLDDDGDGQVDFPDDMGCDSVTDASERVDCEDEIDNDGDGFVDHPQDPGCLDASDLSETAPLLLCDDGQDNDADGALDYRLDGSGDPGCYSPTWATEDPACNDSVDNDGDGLLDLADPTCGGNPWQNSETDILTVGTISNLSSCEHQAEDPGSLATSPYAIWNNPCGAEIFPPPNYVPVPAPYYSRFRVIPAAVSVSPNDLRLSVDASVATDEENASPYEYQVGVVNVHFPVSIDVDATTAWELDLSQVARGMIATYDEGTPQGSSSATAGTGVQFFATAIAGQNVGFDSTTYGAVVTTGFGPSTSALVFDGSRSDSAVLTGVGPQDFAVEFQTRMDVASRGNEAAVVFGIDGVLPGYSTGGLFGSTFVSPVDDYGWSSPPPGFGYAWPRPVEPDGWTATLALRVLASACSNGLDDDGDGTVDFGSGASNDFGCSSAADATENDAFFECDDALDNDGDSLADLADPDCVAFSDTRESPGSECNDGLDNDGDGKIDYRNVGAPGYENRDPGCANELAFSRENPPCSDGFDNDHDGFVDFPSDLGCQTSAGAKENPQCDDNIDNDNDGKIDADGGPLAGAPDSECIAKPWVDKEKGGCGLGAELVLMMPLLGWARRRRTLAMLTALARRSRVG